MKLTKEETEIVLSIRKRKECSLPKFYGTLKRDLYIANSRYNIFQVDIGDIISNDKLCNAVPKSALPKILQKCKEAIDNFTKVPKGTKFVCYLNFDGEEEWSDYAKRPSEDDLFADDDAILDMNADWAKENLENITKCQEC